VRVAEPDGRLGLMKTGLVPHLDEIRAIGHQNGAVLVVDRSDVLSVFEDGARALVGLSSGTGSWTMLQYERQEKVPPRRLGLQRKSKGSRGDITRTTLDLPRRSTSTKRSAIAPLSSTPRSNRALANQLQASNPLHLLARGAGVAFLAHLISEMCCSDFTLVNNSVESCYSIAGGSGVIPFS
jgi:hypothetical protein